MPATLTEHNRSHMSFRGPPRNLCYLAGSLGFLIAKTPFGMTSLFSSVVSPLCGMLNSFETLPLSMTRNVGWVRAKREAIQSQRRRKVASFALYSIMYYQ
jgi:hypothetical protein